LVRNQMALFLGIFPQNAITVFDRPFRRNPIRFFFVDFSSEMKRHFVTIPPQIPHDSFRSIVLQKSHDIFSSSFPQKSKSTFWSLLPQKSTDTVACSFLRIAFVKSGPMRTSLARVWSRHFSRNFRMHTQLFAQDENCDVPIGGTFSNGSPLDAAVAARRVQLPEINKINTDFTVSWLFLSVFRRLACSSTHGRRLFR
jgi:hypothetical protein